jgi:hypothetical protein
MSGLARRLGTGQRQNLCDDLGRKRRPAGLARLVAQQTVNALLGVARLPAPEGGTAAPDPPRHCQHRQALSRAENDLRPMHALERTIAIGDDRQQTRAIFGRRGDADSLCHVDICESRDCISAVHGSEPIPLRA